jgi:putative ABC transport system permease protein
MTAAVQIALRELRHEWLASLCFVAALVGGLAPLLVILALKNGVIDAMVDRLVEDPANRELIAVGAGRHETAFFDRMSARRDVAFVMPATRTINAQANAVRNLEGRQMERAVTLIPSAEGDPLLAGAAPFVEPGKVVLSQELAESLDVAAGGQVEMLIGREIDGQRESARAQFAVLAVLTPDRYGRMAVFVSLSDLLAVERFRDDASVRAADWLEARDAPSSYASFRLYAAQLQDIGPLAQALRAEGVETRPRAQNAALLLGFRDNLGFLYSVIAVLGVSGFWAAMAANLRAMVARQRLSFSLLALIGMQDGARRLVPLVQSVLLVFAGLIATLLLVAVIIVLVNRLFFGSTGENVAYLGPDDVAVTLAIGLVTAVTAAFWARRAIAGIGPDDVLREG